MLTSLLFRFLAFASKTAGAREIPQDRTINGMVLAHQGGWDEFSLVIAPLLVIGVLLFIANRRANRVADERRHTIDPPDDE